MTPHTPSSPSAPEPRHPDIEALADLAEQLTDPADEPALRAHLAECAECADTFAALAEVQELLGSVDTPPMPEDVALRIDTALAAARTEAADTAAGPPGDPGKAAGRLPRTAGRPSAETGPTGPSGTAGTGPGRGRRRRLARIALATAAAAVAIGFGALLVPITSQNGGTASDAPADSAARPAAGGAQQPALGSNTEFSDQALAAQVRQLLDAASATPSAGAPKTPEGLTQGGRPAAGASAPACAAAITGQGERAPLAAAPGSYHSSPVTALVYAVPGTSDEVDVYLITPDCSAPGVLLHRTLPAR
ncbi:anti-sigma factor family protein [Kitasatospora sp. KL5]|uniref:anti-sigma factor family protein n=1 Tax=Kitasatospora sp. KL5 TaxID=3425125 RepID=UPI003D700204